MPHKLMLPVLVMLMSGVLSGLTGWAEEPEPKAAATPSPAEAPEEEPQKDDPEPDRYFAVRGGTLHTVTRGDLVDVTVLTKNGKIIEIAESVEIPEGTEILDASGYHVYPGLIAVDSGGLLGSKPLEDSTDVFSLSMTLGLVGGITTAVSGNSAGKLTYGTLEDLVIKDEVFHTLNYSTGSPDARRKLRQKLEKVRQHIRDLEAYQQEKKTNPDAKEPDSKWLKGEFKKLYGLLRGELTGVATASSTNDIVQYCSLAEEYGIKMVLRGVTEGWTVADRMARANVSAILSIRPPLFSTQSGYDDRYNRPTGRSIENAAMLYDRGVRLAIVPVVTSITLWGVAGRDLLHLNMEAAFAVRGGLPEAAALRAITIDAARILGIDHRVGSIEVGKDADLVITDGDILHYMTHSRYTIVNGRIAYDKQKDTLFDHIRPDGDRDAPPPIDYWPRRLGG